MAAPKSKKSSAKTKKATKSPKKRGGQPGNTNALRHGFYSRLLTAEESADLALTPLDSVASEIAMARAAVRKVYAAFVAEKRPEVQATFLGPLTSAAAKVATLARTEKILSGGLGGVDALVSDILAKLDKEAA